MDITKEVLVAVPKINRPLPPKLEEWMKRTIFKVETVDNMGQEMARAILVSRMYNGKFKSIFFVDSDMSPEIIDLDETITSFHHYGFPIISCLTSTRGPGHQLLLFKKNQTITYPELDETLYREGELVRVYAIGFGGCLIHKEVFDKIGHPWFRTNWDYVIPENGDVRTIGGNGMGADFFFSLRCQVEGIPIYNDCGHILHHMELNQTVHFKNMKYPEEYKLDEVKRRVGALINA